MKSHDYVDNANPSRVENNPTDGWAYVQTSHIRVVEDGCSHVPVDIFDGHLELEWLGGWAWETQHATPSMKKVSSATMIPWLQPVHETLTWYQRPGLACSWAQVQLSIEGPTLSSKEGVDNASPSRVSGDPIYKWAYMQMAHIRVVEDDCSHVPADIFYGHWELEWLGGWPWETQHSASSMKKASSATMIPWLQPIDETLTDYTCSSAIMESRDDKFCCMWLMVCHSQVILWVGVL